jgi:lambda family phage tail tape measure protein
MAEDIASLGLRVDSQGVAAGTKGLDDFAAAAVRADAAAGGAESAAEALAQASRTAQAASNDAARALLLSSNAAQQNTTAMGTASRAATQHAVSQKLAFDPLTATYRKAADAQESINAAQVRGGLSAKQYAASMRLLPAQITDIVTSLASGQPAYLVAIQQGGQLRDSFGGFGATLKALGTVITPTRLLLGGLAGAAALVVAGYSGGQKEGFEFAKAIALTGNAAGTTADRLSDAASNIAKLAGTQGNAASVLAQLAGSGKVAADILEAAALAAVKLERSAGVASAETVKNLVALGQAPADASRKLNDQYHHLTASVYAQIRALEDEGKVAEAAALAQKTYLTAANATAETLEGRLGTLPRLARGVGDAFKGMWDAILDVGRPETLQEKRDLIQKQLTGFIPKDGGVGFVAATGARRERLLNEDVNLQSMQAQDSFWAQQTARYQAQQQSAIRDADIEREANQRAREQALRDADQRRKALFSSSIAAIQRELRAETDSYRQQGELLEAQRAANLITESAYYDEKRRLIAANADAQTRALEAENVRFARESKRVTDAAATAKAAAENLSGTGSIQYPKALEEANRKASDAQAVQIQNTERIAENLAQIGLLKRDAASQDALLGVQEQDRLTRLARGYDQARASAQAYLDSITQQQDRQLAGQGAGNRQRDFDSGRNQIDDRYVQQRQDLEQARIRGDFQNKQAEYAQQLALIEEFHDKALAAYGDYWDRLSEGEANWMNGASEALANYMDEAANTAKQTENLVGNFMQGAEDAWVKFVTTGKLSFKDLANSVIADLARMTTQKFFTQILGMFIGGAVGGGGARIGGATAPMLAANGAAFGFGGDVQAFAQGGAFTNKIVSQPTQFRFSKGAGLMGEAGPEAIMPLKRMAGGQLGVLAQGSGRSSGPPVIEIHNYASGVKHTAEEISEGRYRIARQEVEKYAPKVIASHLEDPNSRVSKSLTRNTTAGRQRS